MRSLPGPRSGKSTAVQLIERFYDPIVKRVAASGSARGALDAVVARGALDAVLVDGKVGRCRLNR